MLERTEVFAEGVKNENRKDVVVLEAAHGNNAFVVTAEFGKSVMEGSIVSEIDVECLKEKIKLRKSALFLIKAAKLLEHCMGSGEMLDKMDVG